MPSSLEAAFAFYWHALHPDLPKPASEHEPLEGRRFRFDFAWPDARVAVELQGGTWTRGRHTRGGGYRRDCEKLNLTQAAGWRVFYLTRQMLEEEPDLWLSIVAGALDEAQP